MRAARWVAGVALAVVLVGGAPQGAPAEVRATHVAGVTVSFGPGNVVHRTVSFTGESISGIDALRGAGFGVEVYGYSGIGAAVCRIDGVGRTPDASCLNGGTSYWAYWRNGQYSRVGGGASEVHDGDQEQWAWGSGSAAPPTTAFPTPTTAPTTSRPVATTSPAVVGSGGTAGTTPPGSEPARTTSTTRAGSSTASGEPATTGGAGERAVLPEDGAGDVGRADAGGDESAAGAPGRGGPGADDGGGGSPVALAGFGVVLAAVVGLTLRARSARGTRPSRN